MKKELVEFDKEHKKTDTLPEEYFRIFSNVNENVQQISQKHYDLLVKIFEEKYDEDVLKEYFTELYNENFFNDKNLPKLKFDFDKELTEIGYHIDGTIALCRPLFVKILNNKNMIVDGINTLGHEYRHDFHDKIDEYKINDEQARKRMINIKHSIDNGVYFTELQINAFNKLRFKKFQTIAEKLLSTSFKGTNFKKWFNSIGEDDRKDLKYVMKYSKYVASSHEYDARVAGIVYTSLVLNIYMKDPKVLANENLYNWIKELSKTTKNMSPEELDEYGDNGYINMQEDFDCCIANSNLYQGLVKAVKKDFKKEIINVLVNAYNNLKSQKELDVLNDLTNIILGEYYDNNYYDKDPQKITNIAISYLNEKSIGERTVAKRIIENYILVGNEQKSRTLCGKLMKYYNENYKQIKFSKDDDFLICLSCQEESFNAYNYSLELVRKLSRDLRFDELHNLIDFVDIYNKTDEDWQKSDDFYYYVDKFMKAKVDAVKKASEWMISRLSTYDALEEEFNNYLEILKNLKSEYCARKTIYEETLKKTAQADLEQRWGITGKQIDKLISETEKKKNQKFPKVQMGE